MSRKTDRKQNIMEANRVLLGEKIIKENTEKPKNDLLKESTPMVSEDHESTDSAKMVYIKGALKNLNTKDLHKIYLSVEKCDPNYESK
jgi:hypothetical protein